MAGSFKSFKEEELLRWLREMPRYKPDQATMERHLQAIRRGGTVAKSERRWGRGVRIVEWFGLAAAVVLMLALIPHLLSWNSLPASPAGNGTGQTQTGVPSDGEDGRDAAGGADEAEEDAGSWPVSKGEHFEPLPPPLPSAHDAVPLTAVPSEYRAALPENVDWALDHAVRADLDTDGHPDYIVAYRLPESGEIQVSVLFSTGGSVREVFPRGGKDAAEPLVALDGIWVAGLSAEGPTAILIGNSMGASAGSLLEVYAAVNAGKGTAPDGKDEPFRGPPNVRYVDTLSYHHVEWGDFDQDGWTEFATWTKDTGNAYQVEVYQFQQEATNGLMPDEKAYPDYFPRVVAYYEQLTTESAKRMYWYYLADAAAKSGQTEKAAKALQRGLAQPEEDYPETERFLDLAERYDLPMEDPLSPGEDEN